MRPMNLTNYLAISQNLIWYVVNLLLCMARVFVQAGTQPIGDDSECRVLKVAHLKRLCWLHNFIFFSLKNCPSSHPPGYQQVAKKSASHTEQVAKTCTLFFLFEKFHQIHLHRIGHGVGFGACGPGILHGGGGWLSHQFRCISRLLSQLCCSVGIFFGRLMDGFCFVFEGCLDPTGRSWDVSKKWFGTTFISMGYSFE